MKVAPFFLCSSFFVIACLSLPNKLWAWGERGHQIVTKAAVRLVSLRVSEQDAEFAELLSRKELMLAHLSNVPDIVWRNRESREAEQNAPTHFLDLEFILQGQRKPSLKQMPKTVQAYRQAIEATCQRHPEDCAPGHSLADKIAKTGHAPFRALQLLAGMEESMRQLKQENIKSKQKLELLNQALIYAGLTSHFIGDLANPNHTTKNYDGQLTGQRGLHSYFESELIAAYDLQLSHYVLQYADKSRPYQRLIARQDPADRFERIWALTLNSFFQLDKLLSLDERYSLVTRGDAILPAQRKPTVAVKQYYMGFAVERLALAADTLAELWLEVWQQSGKPSLATYSSYEYPLSPEFIQVHYLDELN
ncbi:MAG: hypothetical protein ACOH5I_14420 [Oligoflexus sp.]